MKRLLGFLLFLSCYTYPVDESEVITVQDLQDAFNQIGEMSSSPERLAHYEEFIDYANDQLNSGQLRNISSSERRAVQALVRRAGFYVGISRPLFQEEDEQSDRRERDPRAEGG